MRSSSNSNLVLIREGDIVKIQNEFCQVSFNLSQGTWSYANQKMFEIIRNAHMDVVLQDGVTLSSLNASKREFTADPAKKDNFGLYQPVTFSCEADQHEIRIHLHLKCYQNQPYILISMSIENFGDDPINLAQASVINVSSSQEQAKGGIYLGSSPENCHVYLNTASNTSHGVQKVYSGFSVNQDNSVHLCYDGGIYDLESKQSIVFGFLDARKWWSSIEMSYTGQDSTTQQTEEGIDCWSAFHQCENYECAAKTEIEFSPFYLNFIDGITSSYQTYVEMIAQEMEVKKQDRFFSAWGIYPERTTDQTLSDSVTKHTDLIKRNNFFRSASDGGIQLIQLENGWQKELGTYQIDDDQFPKGMQYLIDYVHDTGLKFGLGIMPFCVAADSKIAEAHPEYFLHDGQSRLAAIHLHDVDTKVALFDVSHPDAQKEVERNIKTVIEEWNIDILKVDMLAYLIGPIENSGSFFWHDKTLTSIELYRLGIDLLKRWVSQSFGRVELTACNVPYAPSIGVVNQSQVLLNQQKQTAKYVWEDWSETKQLINGAITNSIFDGIAWMGGLGPLTVDEQYQPLNEAIIVATLTALSSSIIELGDDLSKISEPRLELLKKLFPLTEQSAKPIDLLEKIHPRVWGKPVQGSFDSWSIVGIFNWKDQPEEIQFNLSSLGLDKSKCYLIYEFWNQRYLGSVNGSVTLMDVPPRCARLLCIREEQKNPQLLATDLHFTQGGSEILSAGWDQRSRSFLVVCDTKRRPHSMLSIHVPKDYLPVETACYESNYSFSWDPPIYQIKLEDPKSDLVQISIKFAATSG